MCGLLQTAQLGKGAAAGSCNTGRGATYETAHSHDLFVTHEKHTACLQEQLALSMESKPQAAAFSTFSYTSFRLCACLQGREGQRPSTEGSLALCEESTPEQEQLQLWRSLATALRQRQRADRLAAVVQALLNRM